MKKLLVAAMMFIGLAVNAQEGQFNVGVNLGLPLGDSSDVYSFAFGGEVNYLFNVSDDFKVGPSVSYVNYSGKTVDVLGFSVEVPSASFLPLAAAGRFSVSEQFTLGADLGYALGLSPDGNDGGFYYRPLVGYNVSEKIMLQVSYSGVSVDGGSFSNIGLGAMFSL